MGSFRKTLLTFIDSWISGPKPKLTHIWHKDRHDSLDFSKQRPESQAKQTKTCRCAERSPVSEIQASLRQRSTGHGEVIPSHPPHQLQVQVCLQCEDLSTSSDVFAVITAAPRGDSRDEADHSSLLQPLSVHFTPSQFRSLHFSYLHMRCYFVLAFSRGSFSLTRNEEGKRTEERPKCLSDH